LKNNPELGFQENGYGNHIVSSGGGQSTYLYLPVLIIQCNQLQRRITSILYLLNLHEILFDFKLNTVYS